tara:strand:+ start:3330 stop:3926 length:597 start_codon:yes stop_codon:yes gene_type:complete
MAKLIGPDKINTAVFISGTGSNLLNLIKFSKSKKSKITIKFVISNNLNAKGLGYAKIYNIEKKVLNFKNQRFCERKILSYLKRKNVKLICLAGFLKILSKNFINNFQGKILNIHPSLLPKYKGLNTHKRVLQNKEKFSGCTVHLVNSKLDSGKIILQKKVKVFKNDSEKNLSKRILIQEHKLYPKAIIKLFPNPQKKS